MCRIDSAPFAPCVPEPGNYTSSPLSDGQHTFEVKATDGADNVGSDIRVFTVDTAPPIVTITPTNPTNDNTPTIQFEVQDLSPTTELCAIDLGAGAACAGTFTPPALADGSYTLTVVATDAAGNSASDSSPFVIDTLPPTVSFSSSNPTTTADPTTEIAFTTSGDPTLTICNFDNGVTMDCSSSPVVGPSLTDVPHSMQIEMVDAAGNTGSGTFEWTIDTEPPVVTITSTPPTPTNDNTPPFGFSVSGSPATILCQIDTGLTVPCIGTFSSSPLAGGVHTFTVEARDAAGNSDSDAVLFVIDTTPPDTVILSSSPPALTNQVTASFTFSSEIEDVTFACRIDLGAYQSCSGAPQAVSGQTVGSHTTGILAEGFHTFEVQAVDAAGNVDPSPASFVWFVDLTAPVATIVQHPANPTNQTVGTFGFSSEANATFQCKIDSGGFASCSSSFVTNPLTAATHTLYVQAVDSVGNIQPVPTTFTWTIDNVLPQTFITPRGTNPTASPTKTFVLTANKPATFRCSIDGRPFVSCPSTYTTPALPDGTHTLRVRAVDAAGNVDSTPASSTWTISTVPHECSDGIDNDADGMTDYAGGDKGCSSALDDSELGALACDDGLDNDHDGRTDFKLGGFGDIGCSSAADTSEHTSSYACDDGIDNDSDGKIDYRVDGLGDLGCSSQIDNDEYNAPPAPKPKCSDGIDNDHDGKKDYNKTPGVGDPQCRSASDNSESS